jgi:phage-related protein
MIWEIEFYKKENGDSPVEEFLESLSTKMRAKAIREIDLLEEFGILLPKPHARDIEGEKYKGLWELRIKVATDIARTFYFLASGNKFVLLHGFIKKDEKTPVSELEIARKRMEDYIRRCM